MKKTEYITKNGFNNLKKKIKILENIERIKISNQLSEARDKGDLSENSEYDAAKEAQNMLEIKIFKMKQKLINSRIIDGSKIDHSRVSILSTVSLKNLSNGKNYIYTIVPDGETDLKSGKISINTPISIGLLGKSIGDVVDIKLPNNNNIVFRILNIKFV